MGKTKNIKPIASDSVVRRNTARKQNMEIGLGDYREGVTLDEEGIPIHQVEDPIEKPKRGRPRLTEEEKEERKKNRRTLHRFSTLRRATMDACRQEFLNDMGEYLYHVKQLVREGNPYIIGKVLDKLLPNADKVIMAEHLANKNSTIVVQDNTNTKRDFAKLIHENPEVFSDFIRDTVTDEPVVEDD